MSGNLFHFKTIINHAKNFKKRDVACRNPRSVNWFPMPKPPKKPAVKFIISILASLILKHPEVALDAIRNFSQKVVEYSHSAGIYSYRQRLTEYYKKYNIDITPEEIVVAPVPPRHCFSLSTPALIRAMN